MRLIAGDFPLGPVTLRRGSPITGDKHSPPTALIFPKRPRGTEILKVFRISAVAVGVRIDPAQWLRVLNGKSIGPLCPATAEEGCVAEITLLDGRRALVRGDRSDLEALSGQVEMWRLLRK